MLHDPLRGLLADGGTAGRSAVRALGPAPTSKVLRSGSHGLINPILDVEPTVEFQELRPFQHRVQLLVDEAKSSGRATHVSVYFRDLENGLLFGIDATETFAPSSLLKVPLLMAALRRAAREPGLLEQKLRYQAEDLVTATTSETTLEANREYTLDELLRAMIVNSDNGAAAMVRRAIGPEELDAVYRDLGITVPKVRGPGDSMRVKEYATFFRILYNAGYLDKDRSQKALEYLVATGFRAGLVAGVPPDVTVAHKYGERSLSPPSGAARPVSGAPAGRSAPRARRRVSRRP